MPIVGVRPTTVAALSVLVLAVACGPKNYNYQPEHNTPVAFPDYSGTSTVAETSTAVRAGMGVPVRDGSLEFTVNGLRRTSIAQSPTNPSAQTQAAGEYIIVDLTVKNVGSEPVQYYTDSQSLVIDGKQHSADILAAVYLSPQSADYIQPGLGIDIETPFDVPIGSIPQSILLDEITEPTTATVSLAGAPITPS